MLKKLVVSLSSCSILITAPVLSEETAQTPAQGYNIHVLAPHRHEDGTVGDPYHHYCKSIKPEILQ